ncbi:MAG: M48 family metallopeptidase [Candidatus Saelkia tenebricola]|nr:M48 family metallopeptidase [Candidatus Saelkia tenebricola]
MRFTPRLPQDNVNVSKTSDLREFFWLLGIILAVLVLVYLFLGFALDVVVDRISPKMEREIGVVFNKMYKIKDNEISPLEESIQKLLDSLVEKAPALNMDYEFKVRVVENNDFNALALPGGNIVIFSGLIKEINSQNELAMVLSHELGHFAHKDHLRRLGRRLVLVVISSVLFGERSSVAQFMERTLITADLKSSRQQEVVADKFALDLLDKKYGHVAGGRELFQLMKKKGNLPMFFQYFSTHPAPEDRLNIMMEEIIINGYLVKETIPLDPIYRDQTVVD